MMADPKPIFDPGKYLTRLGTADYLEVKWRLLWLRTVHPDAGIDTELMSHADSFAVFRARVSLPDGGYATGWGSEGLDDFRDYIEKAETKAIGRALAALGFGTQFTPDHEFSGASGGVVDSPIDFASTRGARAAATGKRTTSAQAQPATPSQVKFIQALAREIGLSDEQVDDEAVRLGGHPVGELGRRDASALIEWMQAHKGSFDAATTQEPRAEANVAPEPPRRATGATADNVETVSSEGIGRLHGEAKKRGIADHRDVHALAVLWCDVRSVNDLTPKQLHSMLAKLTGGERLTDEALRRSLENARAVVQTLEGAGTSADDGPLTFQDFWRWIKAEGLPYPGDKLVAWLGEEIKHLTPQQAKELVEARRRDLAELDAMGSGKGE